MNTAQQLLQSLSELTFSLKIFLAMLALLWAVSAFEVTKHENGDLDLQVKMKFYRDINDPQRMFGKDSAAVIKTILRHFLKVSIGLSTKIRNIKLNMSCTKKYINIYQMV